MLNKSFALAPRSVATAIMRDIINTAIVDHFKIRVMVLSAKPLSLETLFIIYSIITEYSMMKLQLNVITKTGFWANKYTNARVTSVRVTINAMFIMFWIVSSLASLLEDPCFIVTDLVITFCEETSRSSS